MIISSDRTNASYLSAVTLATILCAGCGGGPLTQVEQPGERRVTYACRGAGAIEVRYLEAQGIAYVTREGRTMQLRQQPSGSGFAYSNGPNILRGQGREITLEQAGMEPARCRAQSSGSD